MSTNKVVLTGVSARNALIKGANFLADAVKSSLGPFGLNAAIQKNNEITNDGVTIAREIASGGIKDEHEERGARMILEAATKTDEIAGDGTTTATTLAQAIISECVKYLPKDESTFSSRKKPSEIIMKIDNECREVVATLKSMNVPITTKEQLIDSAIVSMGDKEIGNLIGCAQWELGRDGYVIAEDTNDKFSSVERVPGIRVDNGFVTSLAINNQEKQALELVNVPILLTNYTFTDLKPIESVLNDMVKKGIRSLVIVGRGFSESAIKLCMENARNNFGIFPINAPYTNQNEIMKDLSVVLGGRYINNEETDLNSVTSADFGYAVNLIAKRFEAVFVGRDDIDSRKRVAGRIEALKDKIKGSESEFERKNLDIRISQLTNGFSIVKIGSPTELRQKYLKRKADDAVNAVRAALKEGVVAGAGQAFKTISDSLPDTYLLKQPLQSIYNQIMFTAPSDFKIEEWVKDPVLVLRVALENACSIASQFITAGISINTEKDKPLDVLLRKAIEVLPD